MTPLPAREALALAQDAEAWALPLLADLVAINSHADNAAGLGACHARLGPVLAELGFTVAAPVVEVADPDAPDRLLSRRHLVGHRAGAAGPRVLLLGHLDTVFPPDHRFALTRDGDRWRGPGIADMKGGVVTALVTLAVLQRAGVLGRLDPRLVLVSDEEVGSPTGQPVVQAAAAGVDLALCFEAARECGGLVVARKGYGRARITVHGRTGHAGIDHDRAINAFTVLARFVEAAEALEASSPDLTVSPGGAVSVTPGSLGRVPDRASFELEWRFFDPQRGAAVPAALTALATRLAQDTGARIEVDARLETPAMALTPGTDAVLAHYVAAGVALDLRVTGVATAGVGDINHVAAAGATCLDGVGPEGGGFHSDDEYLVVASIARRAALNAVALTRWLG